MLTLDECGILLRYYTDDDNDDGDNDNDNDDASFNGSMHTRWPAAAGIEKSNINISIASHCTKHWLHRDK